MGRSHCDMESLLNMEIIYHDGESYDLVVHKRHGIYFPNRNKTRLSVKIN